MHAARTIPRRPHYPTMSAKGMTLDHRIQLLAQAATLDELRAQLVPILNELAFHSVVLGGGSETLEKWHDEHTDALYGDTARDFAEGQQMREAAQAADVREGAASSPTASARGGPGLEPGLPSWPKDPYQRPPPVNRPAPGEVPASLQALLDHEDASDDSGGDDADDAVDSVDPEHRKQGPFGDGY
jgi:hypothetical protein